MAADTSDAPRPPVERLFAALLIRDPSGATWLPSLLAAAPHGPAKLGELAAAPGWLDTPLAVRGASGRLTAFEYPAVPSRDLLRWFIDHPDRLRRPSDSAAAESDATVRLRRALLDDDPPGSRARAQDRARDLLAASPGLTRAWWRFEEVGRLDCALITGRLVVTIAAGGPDALAPASPWYPPRSRLVRDLEAARQIATGRRWATLLLSETPVPGATEDELASGLPQAAPHLDDARRRELAAAYLGNLTWSATSAAVSEAVLTDDAP